MDVVSWVIEMEDVLVVRIVLGFRIGYSCEKILCLICLFLMVDLIIRLKLFRRFRFLVVLIWFSVVFCVFLLIKDFDICWVMLLLIDVRLDLICFMEMLFSLIL